MHAVARGGGDFSKKMYGAARGVGECGKQLQLVAALVSEIFPDCQARTGGCMVAP
jgi:hypothetical protein